MATALKGLIEATKYGMLGALVAPLQTSRRRQLARDDIVRRSMKGPSAKS